MKKRIGIIDIGSNTVRLVIYEIEKGIFFRLVEDESISVRLAEYEDGGVIPHSKISLLIEVLKFFKNLCAVNGVSKNDLIAVATAAVRNANNRAFVVEMLSRCVDLNIKVLSEFEEANYNMWASRYSLEHKKGLVVDIGGGSTEFVYFEDKNLKYWGSIKLGAVTCSKLFTTIPEKPQDIKEVKKVVYSELDNYPWLKNLKDVSIIGIGGSIRNLGRIIQYKKNYPIATLHNFEVSYKEFLEVFEMINKSDSEKRKSIPGISEKRSDIIFGGLTILDALFETTCAQKLFISSYGLREGILFEKIFGSTKSKEINVESLLEYSVNNYLNFLSLSKKHAKNVARYTTMIFTQFAEIFPEIYSKDDLRIIKTAALLHDIGTYISFYHHPQHSAYSILNMPLFGLSHHEMILIAQIVAQHENSATKAPFLANYMKYLDLEYRKKIKPLSMILKLAEILDKRESGFVTSIRCLKQGDTLYFSIFSKQNLDVEMLLVEKIKPQCEKILGCKVVFYNNK